MQLSFYKALGINIKDRKTILSLSKHTGIPVKRLDYYEQNHVLPSGKELNEIVKFANISRESLMLQMGILSHDLLTNLSKNHNKVLDLLSKTINAPVKQVFKPIYSTHLGSLFQGDCIEYLKTVEDKTFDLIFADPPFNLKKFYLSNINDDLDFQAYIKWTEEWLEECIRTLKDGGSFFLWNLPKWNTYFSTFLNNRLSFKNWIATDVKYSLPISGRLYPSHYSLLYYVKGETTNVFHPDRLPMEVCPKCFTDLKDYGGYKDKMNPLGINISDVWYDIPPVRHKKYKRREEANELSIKLLDRIIHMASNEGDLIFDPFGGSGTTYIVAEMKKRKWVGIELGPVECIVERFKLLHEEENHLNKIRSNYNKLFNEKTKANRLQLKLWTDDTFRKNTDVEANLAKI